MRNTSPHFDKAGDLYAVNVAVGDAGSHIIFMNHEKYNTFRLGIPWLPDRN